ncbi:MAG: hypothetical protein J6D26_04555 [Clostridia bacterium]|nr:hypothetical protein [Clostridia bacterium]
MIKISEIYNNNKSDRIEIGRNESTYFLKIDGKKVKEGYDNIFIYGDNLFVLVSSGRFGAVQYDDELNEIYSLSCKYDTLDEYWHNLLFSNKDEVVYYNEVSKEWIELKDAYISEEFLYGEDKETYLIIEQATGKLIWREYKSRARLIDTPCFVFCGRTNGNPEFYDITNGAYISKVEDGYARYKKHSLVKPIVINGQNIIGVCERNGKLGTIDVGNRKSVAPQWEEITVELKVTCKSGTHKREQTFGVTNIKAGDVIRPEEW